MFGLAILVALSQLKPLPRFLVDATQHRHPAQAIADTLNDAAIGPAR
jgi:hypothetical protein